MAAGRGLRDGVHRQVAPRRQGVPARAIRASTSSTPGRRRPTPSETEGGKGEYDLTREAERFIEENSDRPFFLYLAHNNPHIPFVGEAGAGRREQHGAFNPVYAARIETLDDASAGCWRSSTSWARGADDRHLHQRQRRPARAGGASTRAHAQHAVPRRQGLPLRGRPARAADRPRARASPAGRVIDDAGRQHRLAADAARAGRRAGGAGSRRREPGGRCCAPASRRRAADVLLALPALHQPGQPPGGRGPRRRLEAGRALRHGPGGALRSRQRRERAARPRRRRTRDARPPSASGCASGGRRWAHRRTRRIPASTPGSTTSSMSSSIRPRFDPLARRHTGLGGRGPLAPADERRGQAGGAAEAGISARAPPSSGPRARAAAGGGPRPRQVARQLRLTPARSLAPCACGRRGRPR